MYYNTSFNLISILIHLCQYLALLHGLQKYLQHAHIKSLSSLCTTFLFFLPPILSTTSFGNKYKHDRGNTYDNCTDGTYWNGITVCNIVLTK